MSLPSRSTLSSLACLLLATLLGARYANCQTFSSSGSMALSLAWHTATSLQNGTVLIAGGSTTAGPTDTTEIYNPGTGEFTSTAGFMNDARAEHTATLLANGTVLIAGGVSSSGNTTSSAELYNPATGTFSTTGSMTTARENATATLLQDGTVLIAGGDIGNHAGLTSAEIYNPTTGSFTATTGSMSKPRTNHTATLLAGGTVLITGGQGNIAGQTAWNTAEIYNPTTQTFTVVGTMTTARYNQTATLLTNGTVLIAGGKNSSGTVLSSAEIYTPSTQAFAATGSMNNARESHTATSLYDGTVLIVGGDNGSSIWSSVEVYSTTSNTSTTTQSMTTPREYHTATLLSTGSVLVAGGISQYWSDLSSAELYSYPFTSSVIYPAYKVTSIIYAPPGNKSQDGFTNTTTDSTTTTIGSSFTDANTITFNKGFTAWGIDASASQSFGISHQSNNSTAFQETFSDATGVTNQSASGIPDAIDHNRDIFLIWLNPQLTVVGGGSTPVSYSVGVQPTANGVTPPPDIVQISANVMEANSAGVTTVPKDWLNQQTPSINGQTVYTPGLASICKNLITAEYAARTCTFADQCGCTAADFLPILKADLLLFHNGTDNPISPYSSTASPLDANKSPYDICAILPTPSGSDCRYVPVPNSPGSTSWETETLTGPDSPGGNNIPNSFQQTENTQTTHTQGGQTSESVGASFKIGPKVFNLTEANTLTWTQTQSVGTASGSGATLAVSLSSSTVGCVQNQNINVFEDTVYHTFVFQQPADEPSTCTSLTPAFSITATPNNPAQIALSLGHSMSYTVSASALSGFNGTVALTASGLPAGVTASFSPASITTSTVGSSTMTLSAAYGNSTYIGSSTVTVTGTSGGAAQSAVFTLTTQPLQYKGYCSVQ